MEKHWVQLVIDDLIRLCMTYALILTAQLVIVFLKYGWL